MNRTVTTAIDPERCSGCGLCLPVCPHGTITLHEGMAAVTGDSCLACGHCVAACPTQAVHVDELEAEALAFENVAADNRWLPHGHYDTEQLVRLMRSRRSCRNFTDRPVDRSLLEDLVKIGITAPSGSNCQAWTFTLLALRRDVLALGNRAALFFKRTNRLAQKRYLRWFLKFLGKNQLDFYFHNYYESVKQGLIEWKSTGHDLLFHGATALIIVGSRPGASCPGEDALLATQNILLAAHSLGLGTCLIGFAVAVLNGDKRIKAFIGVPAEETIHAVIALGYPAEKYQGLAGRKKALVRTFERPRDNT
jgi:nitroreductase/NAD-dependent dihydropyrimidine dehydrogenase PreA subunit